MAEVATREEIAGRIMAQRRARQARRQHLLNQPPRRRAMPGDLPRRLVVDRRPGLYYVTARDDAGRAALVLGPFRWHRQARRFVRRARVEGERVDPFACFYAWGTARLHEEMARPVPVGSLNGALGITT